MKPEHMSRNLEKTLSDRFRGKRDVSLRLFIEKQIARRNQPGKEFSIVDLGGSWSYWERLGLDFLEQHDIVVNCINYTESELHANGHASGRLRAAVGDARNLPQFADNSFDMVHSNSVIEHVGRFADMESFAREAQRLAPAHYVQTPYYWCPIDPHFPRAPLIHWLPQSWQLAVIQNYKAGHTRPVKDVSRAMRVVEGSILLDRSQFRHLFPRSSHRFEWLGPVPKSMIAEYPASTH